MRKSQRAAERKREQREIEHTFDTFANAPETWSYTAESLREAARILRRECHLAATTLPADILRERTSRLVRGPLLMLRAAAVECYLKALYVGKGERLGSAGRFKAPPVVSHDLKGLAACAGFAANRADAALLARLATWVTRGRYPIEKDSDLQFSIPLTLGGRGVTWSPADEARYVRLEDRLRQEVRGLQRGPRLPAR